MTVLTLYNSASRRPERFVPREACRVGMYVCGPTVYDRAHLGNARPVVVFDALYRLLRYLYGPNAVTYVRNLTDVEDKINARAAESGRSITDITAETIGWFHEDTDALGVLRPTVEPRATDHVGQMIAMIEILVARGHAYVAEGHVLFAVASYPEYGQLSGRSVDDMIAGARVEVAPYKRDAMDFVLWKPSAPDEPGWDSPWGRGRPGWHIECSAMAREYLGDSFDIHGGGNDLTFPHHENEIAQSRCAHPEGGFARVWLHNEMLQVDGKKMSKSLGNFFSVRDLLGQSIPGEVIRFVLLSAHYRKPMDWTAAKAIEAAKVLRRWRAQTAGVAAAPPADEVVAALADDLNTPAAIAALHRLSASGDAGALAGSAQLLGLLTAELGEWALAPATADARLDQLAARLEALREEARASKNFAAVDRLKGALTNAGVEVRMGKDGVALTPAAGFDPAALDALVAAVAREAAQ